MATGHIGVKEPVSPDKYIASDTISEDGKTKELQRQVLSDSAGAELKGSKADAASVPVTQSTEDKAVQTAIATATGTTAGAAVVTDANGTLQQYLRGIVKLLITAGTVVLGAGTAAIGKLAANSGVDIGDVDVTSVVPGTAATNLGKAIDGDVGATDTGVAILGVNQAQSTLSTIQDGDYDIPSITTLRELRVNDQRHLEVANCEDATAWGALNNDTINIIDSVKHVLGTKSTSFDKVNGAANTVYACVTDTITSINISSLMKSGGFVGMCMYLSSISNVVSVFLRLGTDASHYNQWSWPVASLTGATWMNLRQAMAQPDYASAGNGWNPSAVTYVAAGVEFDAENRTLAGILVDHIHVVRGRIVASDTSTSISSSVSTPNVNIQKVGGTNTATASGAVNAGTLRVTLATDVALPAGTNLVGKVSAGADTATIYSGATALTPKYAFANVAASQTDSNIVTAVGGKKIRVVAAYAVAGATATTLVFNSKPAGAGTAISCLFANGANGGEVLPYNPVGWFETVSGEGLTVTTGAGATTGIQVVYIEV